MEDRTGNQKPQSPTPAYSAPQADLVVFAEDNGWRRPAVLNTLADGTHVIAAGMVMDIREHGTVDAPRATFQLVNDFGQATYAAADTDVLALYSMCLMDGVEISVRGHVRKPFAEDPRTAYISVLSVEPLVG